MSATVDADGVSVTDLEVGDVVIVDRSIGELEARSFVTVVGHSDRGPRVVGPDIPVLTYARSLKIEAITRYDEVVGRDETGAYHLLD